MHWPSSLSTLDILLVISPSPPWPDLLWWITVMKIPFLNLSDCGEIRIKERNSFDLISINDQYETTMLIIMIICLLKIKVIYCFDHADNCFNSSLHTTTVNLVKIKSIVHDYNFICISMQRRKWVGNWGGGELYFLKRLKSLFILFLLYFIFQL